MKSKNNNSFVERVNLLINYDSSKTLSENVGNVSSQKSVILNEQSYNDYVRMIQNALKNKGYNLTVDGWIGPSTKKALIDWQLKNGGNGKGIPGEFTARGLGLNGYHDGTNWNTFIPLTQPSYLTPPKSTSDNRALMDLTGTVGTIASPTTNLEQPQNLVSKYGDPYPAYCSYPDKAIVPGKNKAGVSGMETIPDGKCAYLAPQPNYDNEGSWDIRTIPIFISSDALITFNDFSTQKEILKKQNEMNPKLEKMPHKSKSILTRFPPGTVYKFEDARLGPYETRIVKGKGDGGYFEFGWYYNTVTNKPYPFYETWDPRNSYQKFMDDWSVVTQVVMSVGFLVARGLARRYWPILVAEIFFEGIFGIMSAQRNFERGRNLSAGFDLIFAALPILMKATPIFRGMNPQVGREMVRSMNKAGITASSSSDEVFEWFVKLPDDQAQVFSKVVQAGDELTEESIKRAIGEHLDSLKNLIRANPDKYKRLALLKNLQTQEFTVQMGTMVLDFLLDSIVGEKLTDNQKQRFSGIFNYAEEIDAQLAQEFANNLVLNVENAKEILDSERIEEVYTSITSDKSEKMSKERLNQDLADAFKDFGVWVDDPAQQDIAKNIPQMTAADALEWEKQNPSYKSEKNMKGKDFDTYRYNPIKKIIDGKSVWYYSNGLPKKDTSGSTTTPLVKN